MNTMELTEDMEVKSRRQVPAWVKLGFYVAAGALTWQGACISYEQAKKAVIRAKYTLVAEVVSESLDGKKVWVDNKTNKQGLLSDMTPAQMKMAIYATTLRLESCEATMQTINNMSLNIEVIK